MSVKVHYISLTLNEIQLIQSRNGVRTWASPGHVYLSFTLAFILSVPLTVATPQTRATRLRKILFFYLKN